MIESDVLALRTQDQGDHCLVSVSGELDIFTSPILERELLKVEANDSRPLVVDLRQVTFMDLTGMRVLLAASGRSWANSNRLRVVRGPRTVQRIFEVTGTEAVLPFTDRYSAQLLRAEAEPVD